MEFVERLEEKSEHILGAALAELRRARLEHYERESPETARERLSTLLELTIRCLRLGRAEPIVAYAKQIAHERHAAGYSLFEVQIALNVLEEALWQQVLASVGPDAVARALGLISSIHGMAKDALARTYVSLATREHPATAP